MLNLVSAVAVGALIGAERERRKGEGSARSPAGIRTFTCTKTIQYVYDFGDDWDHSIRIERITEAPPGVLYPRLLKASGACPPEDVGGAPSYGSSKPLPIRTTSSTTISFAGQPDPSIPRMPRSTGSSNALNSSRRNGLHDPENPKPPRAPPEHRHRPRPMPDGYPSTAAFAPNA